MNILIGAWLRVDEVRIRSQELRWVGRSYHWKLIFWYHRRKDQSIWQSPASNNFIPQPQADFLIWFRWAVSSAETWKYPIFNISKTDSLECQLLSIILIKYSPSPLQISIALMRTPGYRLLLPKKSKNLTKIKLGNRSGRNSLWKIDKWLNHFKVIQRK